jgi:hypothetical protein
MPASHSAWVSRTSAAKAWRWRTSDRMISRSRGSGASEKRAITASVSSAAVIGWLATWLMCGPSSPAGSRSIVWPGRVPARPRRPARTVARERPRVPEGQVPRWKTS